MKDLDKIGCDHYVALDNGEGLPCGFPSIQFYQMNWPVTLYRRDGTNPRKTCYLARCVMHSFKEETLEGSRLIDRNIFTVGRIMES